MTTAGTDKERSGNSNVQTAHAELVEAQETACLQVCTNTAEHLNVLEQVNVEFQVEFQELQSSPVGNDANMLTLEQFGTSNQEEVPCLDSIGPVRGSVAFSSDSGKHDTSQDDRSEDDLPRYPTCQMPALWS